ncbi:MAG TPA: hypothetical protein VHE30_26780 [Polyangiaceae bacterium]|nr:hypothetical protein [Polyangiaceae bacterium]
MSTPSEDKPIRHVSELADPRQRFLARVVDHTIDDKWRSAEDFLSCFPPKVIVESLASASALRVKLLVQTTGTHEKIALKKSAASAAEDLELALAEHTTTPEALVSLYPPDDKVRYLDAKKLWDFVATEGAFTVPADDPARRGKVAERLTFIIECALSEGLLTLADVTDGMTFDEIAASLPVSELREVVKHALQIARAGAPLTEERFLAVVPLASLVAHVPLDHTFERVVVRRVAVPAGFVEDAPARPAEESPPSMPNSVLDVPSMAEPPVIQPAPEAAAPAAPDAPSDPGRVPDEDDVRRRVIERLRVIDRLPPSHADISTAVLLSIESMYADLWAVSDDDEREASIRESFPNETLLRTAMLAMIELLDPSVDTRDPIIRDADIAGLIKIVLFEERRRRDTGPSSPRKAVGSQTSGSRTRRSVPPPLPRSSTPPPLPSQVDVGRASSPPPLPAEASGKRDHR